MSYLLNGLYLLLLTVSLPFWIYKAIKTGKYREGLWRKLSGSPPRVSDDRPVVWFHAVSVGEVFLIGQLLDRFRTQYPGYQVVLSTTTNTGYDQARERYPDVAVFYAPLDFSWAVRRVFEKLRPRILVLTELELWPNILLEAGRRKIPVAVINARMGERNFRGYLRLRRLLRSAFSAIEWWGAQTQEYADRIAQLIEPLQSVVAVTGSMKYDEAPTDRSDPKIAELRRLLGFSQEETILVAGSTHSPEEKIVLDAFEELSQEYPELRLVIVPRHKERFEAVAELLRRRGIRFVRRSQLSKKLPESALVTLIDTIGELAAVWGLADFAFVGGSLECGRGGQSMIEPAGCGVPTCFGPDVWNFRDTTQKLLAAGASVQLESRDALGQTLRRWLANRDEASEIGKRARQFILSQQGSVELTCQALGVLLEHHSPARKIA